MFHVFNLPYKERSADLLTSATGMVIIFSLQEIGSGS